MFHAKFFNPTEPMAEAYGRSWQSTAGEDLVAFWGDPFFTSQDRALTTLGVFLRAAVRDTESVLGGLQELETDQHCNVGFPAQSRLPPTTPMQHRKLHQTGHSSVAQHFRKMKVGSADKLDARERNAQGFARPRLMPMQVSNCPLDVAWRRPLQPWGFHSQNPRSPTPQ